MVRDDDNRREKETAIGPLEVASRSLIVNSTLLWVLQVAERGFSPHLLPSSQSQLGSMPFSVVQTVGDATTTQGGGSFMAML